MTELTINKDAFGILIKQKHSVWIFIFTRRENFGKFEVLSTKSKNLTGGNLL